MPPAWKAFAAFSWYERRLNGARTGTLAQPDVEGVALQVPPAVVHGEADADQRLLDEAALKVIEVHLPLRAQGAVLPHGIVPKDVLHDGPVPGHGSKPSSRRTICSIP